MEDYEIIGWPEIQDYMSLDGFDANATLIEENGAMGIDSCTYLVSKDWLNSLNEENTQIETLKFAPISTEPGKDGSKII